MKVENDDLEFIPTEGENYYPDGYTIDAACIMEAANEYFFQGEEESECGIEGLECFFEHEQWFLRTTWVEDFCDEDETTYAVIEVSEDDGRALSIAFEEL